MRKVLDYPSHSTSLIQQKPISASRNIRMKNRICYFFCIIIIVLPIQEALFGDLKWNYRIKSLNITMKDKTLGQKVWWVSINISLLAINTSLITTTADLQESAMQFLKLKKLYMLKWTTKLHQTILQKYVFIKLSTGSNKTIRVLQNLKMHKQVNYKVQLNMLQKLNITMWKGGKRPLRPPRICALDSYVIILRIFKCFKLLESRQS